jgi:formate hydrogenlyase subunit 3/multisubunit Na+/H+ antiporter MnhD subunit
MDFVREEAALIKAWVLCTAVIICTAYLPGPDGQSQAKFGLISALVTVLLSALSLAILRFFAGKYRDSRKPPYKKEPIGTWGYSWRFLVAYSITVSFGVIPIVMLERTGGLPMEIFAPTLLFVIFPAVCITFFCPNRKERLARLKTLLTPRSA